MGVTDVESEFKRLGPYVLLRASGAGGMARIDLALRGGPDAADVCVLKRLHADYRSPEQEARFRREAAIARRLSHDAIARTLGIDEIDGELLLLQELVMGVDLRRLTARVVAIGERLPVPLAVYVVSEVARALQYAHTFRKLGIVHRDVTPDNIMLAFSGAVKLVDFGIARSNADATLTQAGFVVGRPTYTAPEVWAGARADRRSDIYSLGVVLWQLLAGRPLEADDLASASSMIHPDVPAELAAINLRAFDADPTRRYPSAGDLQQALAPYLPSGFDAPARLSELLARHFDVVRERQMLAEDVAHARPLLAAGGPRRAAGALPPAGSRNRQLLVAAAVLLLLDGVLWKLSHRMKRATTVSRTASTQISVAPPGAESPAKPVPVAATAAAATSPATMPGAAEPTGVAPAATAPSPTTPAPAGQVAAAPSGTQATGASAAAGALDRPSEPTPPQRDRPPRQARDRRRVTPEPAQTPSPPAGVNKVLAEAQDEFDRGNLPTALALARDAAERGAGSPAYILIGTIMMNGRRYEEAERAFAEAARRNPSDARAIRLLAMVREIRKMGDGRP